jgi:hypothetical protein
VTSIEPTLTGIAAGEHAATFYLEAASLAVSDFDGIVSGLPRRSKFNAEDSGRFIFGDLARDAERLASQYPVLLREFLGFAQDFHDAILIGHRSELPFYGVSIMARQPKARPAVIRDQIKKWKFRSNVEHERQRKGLHEVSGFVCIRSEGAARGYDGSIFRSCLISGFSVVHPMKHASYFSAGDVKNAIQWLPRLLLRFHYTGCCEFFPSIVTSCADLPFKCC